MRWRQGYSLYQIVRPVSNELLVFDMIHYEEMHGMEVVSNAPPVAQEVSTWGKRMRAASRPFVTPGFIEAKVGDVDSALRTARGVSLDRSVLQPHTMITPSTPPVSGGDSYVRRARKTITAHSHSLALFSFDRLLLRTNDTLLHSQVCVLCEPERDNFNVVIFASRLSNTHAGKPRRSDFAGCMITLDKDSRVPGVSADRDITEKGYEMLCPPQWWGRRYIALGRQRPAATNVPYCDSRGTWRQDYTVLSGRFLTSLFNPPTSTSLPLPLWACGEGVAVTVMRPHLVVHHKKLHVFYLIQVVTTPSVRSVSGDRSSFCETLNPSAVISILPVDDVEEERCGLEVSLGSSDMSPQSNAPSSAAPTRTCQYGLAHAVCEEDA
ncbi:unnamed protein product [Trypanosoma congolense IL3000]|uniref:WGS project CAEQ00000000 data, annotated contig 1460 n=1 Tax=Trypanosoma congolense (strain IL3000) TaxID=1068625 RepID=F9W6G3_TRYCI|nr:unnamed protein product [Trypanosoma congolense IL3000]